MEEEKRERKEYYQVTLDTGRIFWITFLIGIVVIGIFIFGYYIGGEKIKNGLSALGKFELFHKDDVISEADKKGVEELALEDQGLEEQVLEEQALEDQALLDIFETNLEAETRFLDVDSIEKAVRELHEEPVTVDRLYEEEEVQVPVLKTYREKSSTYTYRETGDYYIQVASFMKKENAIAMAEKLRKKLYKVVIEEASVDEKIFYRVRVGPFETKSIAKNTMAAMENRYNIKGPFVLKKNS